MSTKGSLQKRVEIIGAVDKAPPSKKKDITTDFDTPANTLSTILKNRSAIPGNDQSRTGLQATRAYQIAIIAS